MHEGVNEKFYEGRKLAFPFVPMETIILTKLSKEKLRRIHEWLRNNDRITHSIFFSTSELVLFNKDKIAGLKNSS